MSAVPGAPSRGAQAARAIWEAALRRVQPGRVIERVLLRDGDGLIVLGERIVPGPDRRVRVLSVGKAADAMARAAAGVLGELLSDGLIVTKTGHAACPPPVGFDVLESSHPLPDESSVAAGERILAFLAGGRIGDQVLLLVSGGASSLAVLPRPPLKLADIRAATDLLQRAGATIHELNAVRKHLDRIKGGGLLAMAAPARVAGLLMSDVVGDSPATIGSGPSVPDPTTFRDAVEALRSRGVWDRTPAPVRDLLARGVRGAEPETVKPGDPEASGAATAILTSGRDAVDAASAKARELGFEPLVLSTTVEGEAREVARVIASVVRESSTRGRPAVPPAAILWAGETTVTVRGHGRGGRNQESALAAAIALDGLRGVTFAALGTDGTDGPTDAAGGVVDGGTAALARAGGVDLAAALADNDSYAALDRLGALIRTGPTGTHVNDLGIAILEGAGVPTSASE